ncbi:MAG: DUF342 domain-containing protein [Chitinivibrionales bacterium]|nr:DUF342 domain-containing protein [Chitinivibrionales bacterium]MBD3359030.1 DUF342 domain-containing protein [Chitinivibrionales bacterium]
MDSMQSIRIGENGTKAFLNIVDQFTKIDDVEGLLRREGVVEGIRWDLLEKAVEKSKESGTVCTDVLIADSHEGPPEFHVGNPLLKAERSTLSPEEFAGICRETWTILKLKREGSPVGRAIFVGPEETFLSWKTLDEKDVYGKPTKTDTLPFRIRPTVAHIHQQSEAKLQAVQAGYVGLDEEGCLDILSPVRMADDKMRMWYAILPVDVGRRALLEHIEKCAWVGEADPRAEVEEVCLSDVPALMDKRVMTEKLVRCGRKPIPGRDARIHLHVDELKAEAEKSKERVSVWDHTSYIFVSKGTVLAEMIYASAGIPGRDCLGQPIRTVDGRQISFEAGDNVFCSEEEGVRKYLAAVDGVVKLNKHGIAVSETLYIDGDVGPVSGNVAYKRDVVVTGSVRGGFTIHSQGDVRVLGAIENGAVVKCGGNLEVKEGLYGERASVMVGGDAAVSLIQNSRIRVHGNLRVRNYIFQSNVYCRGELVVRGLKLYDAEVGALVGGSLTCMSSILLHSAGTDTAVTKIFCGIDPVLYDKLREISTLQTSLKNRIDALQYRMGFSIAKTSQLVERLKKLPPQRKEGMKKALLEMRTMVEELRQTSKKKAHLEEKALAKDVDRLSVRISGKIIPVIRIRLHHHMYSFESEGRGRLLKIVDQDVCCIPMRGEDPLGAIVD